MSNQIYALHLVTPDQADFALAEQVEKEVFDQVFHNSPELLAKEYEAYHDSSKFLCVYDKQIQKIVGVMRLIHDSPSGFKSLTDLERSPWNCSLKRTLKTSHLSLNPTKTLDIATLAIVKDYRIHDGNHQ